MAGLHDITCSLAHVHYRLIHARSAAFAAAVQLNEACWCAELGTIRESLKLERLGISHESQWEKGHHLHESIMVVSSNCGPAIT